MNRYFNPLYTPLLFIALLLCIAIDLTACTINDQPSGGSNKQAAPVPSEDPFTLMYATQDVNLRTGAGVENSIVTVVIRGDEVKSYTSKNGWNRVKYGNQRGYVNSAYLSLNKPLSYEQLAENIAATMTLEEKVGQMFFVRCRKDTAVEDLKKFHLGGYILFADDIESQTKKTLKSTIQGYQDASHIKMLIGVDEEGGSVVRVSKYPEFRAVPFHSPQSLYAEGGFQLIADDTKEKAKLLKSLGFNVNLAPICDVSTNPSDYIYKRTFGKNAEDTAEYIRTVVKAMNANGIGCTLKHFPGYGNNADTHKGIAFDNRSYDLFLNSDFVPFHAGIESGAGSILVSHNIVKCMDEELPASLSPAVHKILREELNFRGVIMTDDLKMDAIREYTGDEAAAVMAVKAGNDLILATDFDVQIPAVLYAVRNGTITEERITKSVLKILEWKLRLGIIS